MRLWAEFGASDAVRLPVHYNHAIQALIYQLLPGDYRQMLHDEGYRDGERRLKLFTFSRIFAGVKKVDAGFITFQPPIKICISSPIERFLSELVNQLIKRTNVKLLGNELRLNSIELPRNPTLGKKAKFYTLSPITVYSTLYSADKKKKTYYYSPYEQEFSQLVSNNLLRKYKIRKGEDIRGDVRFIPVGKLKENICMFKGTVIKAWSGRFIMEGDERLIEIAYEAGVGAKNSAGFGMIEVVSND